MSEVSKIENFHSSDSFLKDPLNIFIHILKSMNFTCYFKKFHNYIHATEREKDVTKIQLEKELLKKQKEKERTILKSKLPRVYIKGCF